MTPEREAQMREMFIQYRLSEGDEPFDLRLSNAKEFADHEAWEQWQVWLACARALEPMVRDGERWNFLREQHEGRDEFLDAEGFSVSEPTAHAFTVFQPGRDVCLEPIGSFPGELDSTIDAAMSAALEEQKNATE